MTEKVWIKLCMIIAEHYLEHVGSVMSTCQKLSARNVKADEKTHAQAANMRADERAARRQAALEAMGIPDETALALKPPCSVGDVLATCRACKNGWNKSRVGSTLPRKTTEMEGGGASQSSRTPKK